MTNRPSPDCGAESRAQFELQCIENSFSSVAGLSEVSLAIFAIAKGATYVRPHFIPDVIVFAIMFTTSVLLWVSLLLQIQLARKYEAAVGRGLSALSWFTFVALLGLLVAFGGFCFLEEVLTIVGMS